jgi:S1-C subfamily serine protease
MHSFIMKLCPLLLGTMALPMILGDAYIVNGGGGQYYASTSLLPQQQPTTTKQGLALLSVRELKRLLQERGVDFRDCLEKNDLVERLQTSQAFPNKNNGRGGVPPLSGPSTRPSVKTEHEQQIISTFEAAGPAVAFITTSPSSSSRRNPFLPPEPSGGGTGSGFLWDNLGHVVTNYHVIAASLGSNNKNNNSRVSVKLQGLPEALPATIVGVDPEKDLAVLKLPPNVRNLPAPIDIGSSDSIQVGQTVLAIGNPFGLDTTLTTGVVSAVGRDLRGFGGRIIQNCVQTDASINPGNSGGPLLDSNGCLIGVNTMIYTPNGVGNVGIGFSIPVDTVRRVVNQLIRYGKTVRPSLGVHAIDDRLVQQLGRQLRRPLNGVLVGDVTGDAKGKLNGSIFQHDGSARLGDLIVAVDDKEPVQTVEDLLSIIEQRKVGDQVKLTVLRNCDPNIVETVRIRLATRETSSSSS